MMKKHDIENKYNEITKELKSEKMPWNFEEFIKKTKEAPMIKATQPTVKSGGNKKLFWLAASMLLLLSLVITLNYYSESKFSEQDQLVKNEIKNVKEKIRQEEQLTTTATLDSIPYKNEKRNIDSMHAAEPVNETAIMDQILSKRGRLKKEVRPRFVHAKPLTDELHSIPDKRPAYNPSYVIINGQKIENEQEAIDITKYSFQILSENVSKTVAQTEVMNDYYND